MDRAKVKEELKVIETIMEAYGAHRSVNKGYDVWELDCNKSMCNPTVLIPTDETGGDWDGLAKHAFLAFNTTVVQHLTHDYLPSDIAKIFKR